MRNSFPLFQSHLDLAHDYWKHILCPGDTVIDATCGNGHDALVLAQLALTVTNGSLYCIDIQDAAITNSKALLAQHLTAAQMARVHWIQQCHSRFPEGIVEDSVKLIVYNLGYLPGGDKQRTTQVATTLQSLESALKLVCAGGCISVTAYPGHEEGAQEEGALLKWVASLSPNQWSCCQHRWLNRKAAPSLLLIQKAA